MAGAQSLLPLAFGFFSAFSFSFLLLLFSGVRPCRRLCVGGLWSVVLCFQLTRALPLCFLAAFTLPRVRPCAEGSRARQICCFCFSHDQAVSHGWCAVFASLGLWRLFCLFFLLSSPSLLAFAPLQTPVRRWPVVCCFVLSADQGSPIVLSGCLHLAACPALRRRQSCQADLLFLFFT